MTSKPKSVDDQALIYASDRCPKSIEDPFVREAVCEEIGEAFITGYALGKQEADAELVEALAWYGWKMVPECLNEGRTEVTTELGRRAREALRKYEESKK